MRFRIVLFGLAILLTIATAPMKAARYTLMITTGDLEEASTSAKIKLTLYGQKRSFEVEFNDGMKRKDTFVSKLKIGAPLGKLRSILVEHDNSGDSPNWFLTRMNLFVTDGRKRYSYFLPCERWFSKTDDDKKTKRFIYPVESLYRYQVDVYTGKQKNAGTNARVRLALKGSGRLSLRPYQLDGPGKLFQPGSVDRFTVYSYHLGDLRKLALHQDKRGKSPDWFVEKVFIRCLETDQVWLFPFKRWLKGNKRQYTAKAAKKERSEAK